MGQTYTWALTDVEGRPAVAIKITDGITIFQYAWSAETAREIAGRLIDHARLAEVMAAEKAKKEPDEPV